MAYQTPFRIIALPIMLIVGSIAIFYKLFLHVGTFVLGLVYIFPGICIVSALFINHNLIYAMVPVATGAVVFLGAMFAEAVSMGLDALTAKLGGFIFS